MPKPSWRVTGCKTLMTSSKKRCYEGYGESGGTKGGSLPSHLNRLRLVGRGFLSVFFAVFFGSLPILEMLIGVRRGLNDLKGSLATKATSVSNPFLL